MLSPPLIMMGLLDSEVMSIVPALPAVPFSLALRPPLIVMADAGPFPVIVNVGPVWFVESVKEVVLSEDLSSVNLRHEIYMYIYEM